MEVKEALDKAINILAWFESHLARTKEESEEICEVIEVLEELK